MPARARTEIGFQRFNSRKDSVSLALSDIQQSLPMLNIHVSARNVAKVDRNSPSDPVCLMNICMNGKWSPVGHTEVIWNNPNPCWVKFFQVPYAFECEQRIQFIVADVDHETDKITGKNEIGQCETTIQALVQRHETEVSFPLRKANHSDARGTLLINIEQSVISGSLLCVTISAQNLKKMRTFSKNSPYFVVQKPAEGGSDIAVYHSEVLHGVYSARWKDFEIPLGALYGENYDNPLTITFYDQRTNQMPALIGCVSQTMQSFLEHQGQTFDLQLPGRRTSQRLGTLKLLSFQIVRRPTFLDYLQSGLQLNLITAIDFTASNGKPSKRSSLHYLAPNWLNPYETCICAIGAIICPYDFDQQFAVYGFGGKINNSVSHCFPLTFNYQNPNVLGLEGILGIYRQALGMVELSEPTHFAPVITAANQVAVDSWDSSKTYTILLIITDGCIMDMPDTIDAIVMASGSPLSIIIIGVGEANFQAMHELDGDEAPLKSRQGQIVRRDIVQFVPFNKFQGNQAALAAEVLAEVPKQVDTFCSMANFFPQLT